MKFFKSILAVAALMLSLSAQAQSFDVFGSTRPIVLAPPRLLDASAATFTNGPIDIHGYQGVGSVDITSFTNTGGAITVSFYTSADKTNWTALANYANAVSSSQLVTNYMYGGTALYATNQYLLPGTLTTPTSATAGFATPYVDSSPFTNSGALTITAKGVYRIGFNVADAGRYLIAVWTPTGSSSNDVVSAVFTARKSTEVGTR